LYEIRYVSLQVFFPTFWVLCQYIKRTYIMYIRQMRNRIVILGLFLWSCNQCILVQLNPPSLTTCTNLQMSNCSDGFGFSKLTPDSPCSCVKCPLNFCSSPTLRGPCIPCRILPPSPVLPPTTQPRSTTQQPPTTQPRSTTPQFLIQTPSPQFPLPQWFECPIGKIPQQICV